MAKIEITIAKTGANEKGEPLFNVSLGTSAGGGQDRRKNVTLNQLGSFVAEKAEELDDRGFIGKK